MKQTIKFAIFASTLAALNACGSNTQENSETAGLFDNKTMTYNLGEQLQKKGVRLPTFMRTSSNGIELGGKSSVLFSNNIVYKSEPQKVSAAYTADLTVIGREIGNGHVIDVGASARSDKIEGQYHIRLFGDSKVIKGYKNEGELKATKTFRVTRDFGVTQSWPILPALSLDFGGSAGGELNLTIAPNVNIRTKTAEIILTPGMKLYGKVKAGGSILFAEAGAKGSLTVIDGMLPVSGGLTLKNNEVVPTFRVEPLKLGVLGGRVDLYANLSLGNVLPGPAKSLWKTFVGNGLEYTYPVVIWSGYDFSKGSKERDFDSDSELKPQVLSTPAITASL